MTCFYCGRPLKEENNENGDIRLRCVYPRCKLKPETDYEPTYEMAVEDILLIKQSLR